MEANKVSETDKSIIAVELLVNDMSLSCFECNFKEGIIINRHDYWSCFNCRLFTCKCVSWKAVTPSVFLF